MITGVLADELGIIRTRRELEHDHWSPSWVLADELGIIHTRRELEYDH